VKNEKKMYLMIVWSRANVPAACVYLCSMPSYLGYLVIGMYMVEQLNAIIYLFVLIAMLFIMILAEL
jgi:hypothetical protein